MGAGSATRPSPVPCATRPTGRLPSSWTRSASRCDGHCLGEPRATTPAWRTRGHMHVAVSTRTHTLMRARCEHRQHVNGSRTSDAIRRIQLRSHTLHEYRCLGGSVILCPLTLAAQELIDVVARQPCSSRIASMGFQLLKREIRRRYQTPKVQSLRPASPNWFSGKHLPSACSRPARYLCRHGSSSSGSGNGKRGPGRR